MCAISVQVISVTLEGCSIIRPELEVQRVIGFYYFLYTRAMSGFSVTATIQKKKVKLSFCYKLVGGRADHPLTRRLVV